ncbi:hypothetical protein KN815_31445 [Streptomyces sp. 4503]|uniref:Integral membrane protein n=1 Tax=Streptomyces niphimycinicus TaxID=2842201 RepID=A0ABS6CNJ5_9ACTN|nr:hypothetical protein [Streptomyces niphimycinicus]MBU3868399.1 hypothetical protein [Streptomyces niphimycinicus]
MKLPLHSGIDTRAVENEKRTGRRQDVLAAAAAAVLFAVAAVVGTLIQRADHSLYVEWAPLYADWLPHVGPGTPAALAVAVAVVAHGPRLAARLPWRGLLGAVWAASMAWIWSLALVDGWQRGVAGRLTARHEYLRGVDRFHDIGAALRGFTGHILLTQPDHWPAHIAGHPPGAVLTFVGLDRLGLGGGGWAGAFCITVGGSAAVAILVTLRALGQERAARAAAPFLVLAPGAVWVGASADGYFAAVAAWGLALLALAATRTVRAPGAVGFCSGLLLGLTAYLSYGLTLLALPAAAVLLLARTARPLPFALMGAAVVAGAFTLTGFQWWEGYSLLVERYYQGVASDRPYAYWVWANLAVATVVAGPACVAGARRMLTAVPETVRRLRPGGPGAPDGLVVPAFAVLLALVVADLSGMSKAETERIWLPFLVWLLPTAALLPAIDRRRWLMAQACLGLLVNHLLLTGW